MSISILSTPTLNTAYSTLAVQALTAPDPLLHKGPPDAAAKRVAFSQVGLPDLPDELPSSDSAPSTSTVGTDTSGTSSTSTDSIVTGVYGASLTDNQKTTLQVLSRLLGTDSGGLITSLQNGTPLTSLLSTVNVDRSTAAELLPDGLLFDATA